MMIEKWCVTRVNGNPDCDKYHVHRMRENHDGSFTETEYHGIVEGLTKAMEMARELNKLNPISIS